jgi:general secretion pathway protein F
MTRAEELREAIKSALVYPILLLATAGLSLMFILTDVLPEFEPLFAEAGKALPLPTRIVMAVGYLVGHWGWLAALGAAAGYVTLRRWLRHPATRRRVDARILRVPLFGRLAMEIEAARFARSLGTITRAGLPLPAAMALASETLGNTAIRHAIVEAAVRMREGERLSVVLKRDRLLPPLAAQLAEVGEESGKLEDMLLHQAELFEREVRRTVERLLAALVPGLIASVLVAILKVNELAL